MTSINDVLKASKGLPVDDIFAQLWGRKLSGDYTIVTYTGTLPAVLTGTKAGYLHKYKVYGNTEQTGTPTPSEPIVPSECGERTENEAWTGWAQDYVTRIDTSQKAKFETIDGRTCLWFDVSAGYGDYDNKYLFKTDWKENTRYTFSFKALRLSTESTARVMRVWYADGSSEYFPVTINSDAFESYTFTTAVNKTVKYITPSYTSGGFRIDIDTFMVNAGSIALPYEPYGYKLPLLSGSTPVDIYLGESQTTRQIKKLVLTGTETPASITQTTDGNNYCVAYKYSDLGMTDIKDYDELTYLCSYPVFISSHFTMKSIEGLPLPNDYNDIQPGQVGGNTWIAAVAGPPTFNRYIIFCVSGITTINNFKTYLAQQYANGTPVTIWYVLAEPETAVVNEPLRKIGDYADTIDSTQTSAQIPTTANSTTISWGGQGLEPSEVEFEYERK